MALSRGKGSAGPAVELGIHQSVIDAELEDEIGRGRNRNGNRLISIFG